VLVMTSTTDNVHMLHKPNFGAIRDHLEILFHRAAKEYPQARVEIAWSDPSGQVNSANSFPITKEGLDEAAREAVRRNADGRNVYVGVNPRRPETAPWGRAKAHEILCAYFQFADIDKPEGIARLRQKLPLNYTMAVTTGRTPEPRVHPYWELEDAVTNMGAWRAQQEAIADYFGSDRVIDAGRIMRLAGTVSSPTAKKAEAGYKIEPVTLRTIYDDERRDPVSSEAMFYAYPWTTTRHDFSDEHANGRDPGDETGPTPQPGADRFDTGRRDPLEFVRNINAGINLHNNARDLIAHLVNTGYRDWLIRDYLDRLLRPVSDGGTLGQIEELIRSARQKFNTAEPPPEAEGEDFNAPPPLDIYEPLDFAQLASLPPVSYLIDGLITDTGLTVLYGDPASGKTFLALDMALHIAYGAEWHGRETTRPAGILYIAGEGVRGVAKRISAWRHYHGCQADPAPFLVLPTAIDFLDLASVQKLARTIEHHALQHNFPVGLIVVDTVARNMVGDENDATDMSRFVSACDALREKFAVALIGVHHCGKDHERGMRGSTALPGASDTIVEVERNDNVITVTVKKQKDDDELAPFYMEMHKVPIDPLNAQSSMILKMLKPNDAKANGNGKSHNPTPEQINLIFDEIERAWNAKNPWSCMTQTKQWGRYLPDWIASNTAATVKQAQVWLAHWLMNNCLELATCDSHSKQKGLHILLRPGTYTGN
jgi:hypothetical protein